MWQLFPQGHFNFPHLLFLHRVPPLALLLVFHSILPLVALFDPILTLRVWENRIWRTKMSTLFPGRFPTEPWIFVSTWTRSASWLSAEFSPDACGQQAFMRMQMHSQMQHIGFRWGLTNARSCTKKKRRGAGGERAGGLSRNTSMKKVRGCLFPFQTLPVPNYRGNLQSGALQMCRSANPHEPSLCCVR